MKLAEALIKRADLKARIAQLATRMAGNALVQEGDEPDEDITELQTLYESAMDDLERIIVCINKTNNETMLDSGISLAAAIANRDCIKSKISAYQTLRDAATKKPSRYDRYERSADVKYIRTVEVTSLQKTIDDLSRQYRELDTKIQGRNWNVDLL
jgi:hypothetical protein